MGGGLSPTESSDDKKEKEELKKKKKIESNCYHSQTQIAP